ncbi:MAG: 16S rRNA processing protein RimM [Clostridia bacterium]|nr:16S rRNA processing protein RimM [Clostridia bacterium]
MQEKLLIGEILKPQGIRGEVKVKPYVDNADRFYDLKTVFLEDTEYKVLHARVGDGFVFLALSSVADRNQAELLRGKKLYVTRENAVPLTKNTFYIVDVLGAEVVDETGHSYGVVADVTPASRDIFTLERAGKKPIRFPFLKDLVLSVDTENKKITVNKKRMGEVAVYED